MDWRSKGGGCCEGMWTGGAKGVAAVRGCGLAEQRDGCCEGMWTGGAKGWLL